jgi:serine/threonine-protein kinase RsbT
VQIRRPGIEVIVEDRGPGIADIELAMKENVSTGGTLGLGLPGTRRLVDEFDIESQPGQGTRVRIIKWS